MQARAVNNKNIGINDPVSSIDHQNSGKEMDPLPTKSDEYKINDQINKPIKEKDGHSPLNKLHPDQLVSRSGELVNIHSINSGE